MEVTLYDLSTTASLTSLEPDIIINYCKLGLISPAEQKDEHQCLFNDEGVYLLRRIEFLRIERGIPIEGVSIILSLMREIAQLRSELRFQREHLPT
jgi:DNA-binding transcriptional MerR regulator